MSVRLTVLCLLVPLLALAVRAEDCTDGKFGGAALKAVKKVHGELIYGPDSEQNLAAVRAELVSFRQAESTCLGQNSLDYAIAMIDVTEAPLQQGVDAMPTILQSSAPEYEKANMMSRLINRFYADGQFQASVSVAGMAVDKFPENVGFKQKRALLLAYTGQDEEARAVAQALLDEELEKVPRGIMPFAGWVRYALTEVSGDAEDRRAVLAQFSDHLGKDAEPVVAEFADVSVFAMVMAREFDRKVSDQPAKPPLPSYPNAMASLGHEGSCETYFDVSVQGVPENVVADCTDPGFAKETARAVSEVRFAPFLLNGQPRRLVSVTYPLEYRLER